MGLDPCGLWVEDPHFSLPSFSGFSHCFLSRPTRPEGSPGLLGTFPTVLLTQPEDRGPLGSISLSGPDEGWFPFFLERRGCFPEGLTALMWHRAARCSLSFPPSCCCWRPVVQQGRKGEKSRKEERKGGSRKVREISGPEIKRVCLRAAEPFA